MRFWKSQMTDKRHQNEDTITTIMPNTSTGPGIVIFGWMLVVLLPSIFFIIYFIISGKIVL